MNSSSEFSGSEVFELAVRSLEEKIEQAKFEVDRATQRVKWRAQELRFTNDRLYHTPLGIPTHTTSHIGQAVAELETASAQLAALESAWQSLNHAVNGSTSLILASADDPAALQRRSEFVAETRASLKAGKAVCDG